MAKRIEIWPVERLVPYERNARTHSDGQIAELAASITEFGFTNPVLVDSNDGILAGHGRLEAAKALGLEQVPVVVLDHLSDAQRRAYILADNRIAMNAGWDDEILKAELQALASEDFDLSLLGWGDNLPEFAPDLDYSTINGATVGGGNGDGGYGDDDEDDLDKELDELEEGVKRAIQIEFEPEHYEEAAELIKWWRKQGAYIGMMLMDKLRIEKDRHERQQVDA